MYLSTIIPLSLSLVGSVFGQAKPQAISINVGAVGASGASRASGAASAAGSQPTAALAGSSAAAPAAAGSVITIRPQGVGQPAAATAAAQQGQGATPAGSPGVIGQQPGQQPAQGAAGSSAVWVVKVGSESNALVFSPNTVTAKVGEFVQFQFYSMNHSVASSTFAAPCTPDTDQTRAFFSGFMPTTAQGQLTYTVPVKDTNPIWIYCSQAKHCQDGMVGVINPPATGQTLQAFQAAAAQAPNNVTPNGGAAVGGVAPGTPGAAAAPAGVAQTTAGAISILARRASWELAATALAAWFLL